MIEGYEGGGGSVKRVKTALLVPGMVIAKDVHNASNILVMGKNTVLTDESITKLGMGPWQVTWYDLDWGLGRCMENSRRCCRPRS